MLNLILSVLLLGYPNPDDPKTEIRNYKSYAYEINSNEFIYNEVHKEIFMDGKIQSSVTEYKSPDGELLSKRVMNFGAESAKPSFTFEDYRRGYIEGAEVINTGVVRAFTRDSFDETLEEVILRVEEPFVIDGGLTFFFRENWDRLLAGETIEFNFITPAKLDYFKFRVMKEDLVTISGREGMRLRLEVASFILRAFVNPIFITYALDDKHILYYTGISNVNNDEGKSYNVEIDFTKHGEMK